MLERMTLTTFKKDSLRVVEIAIFSDATKPIEIPNYTLRDKLTAMITGATS